MTEQIICAYCEEEITRPDEMAISGEEYSEYEGQPLHDHCYWEAPEMAVIIFGDNEDYPSYITPTRDDTEGIFSVAWHSTDPWRGYYKLSSGSWVKVHDDYILSMSKDEANLKKWDDLAMELLREHGIPFARAFPRTSNLFSTGYELWIPAEKEAEFEELISNKLEQPKEELRNSWEFTQTAITGKDPDQCDEKDKLVSLIGGVLLGGDE